ncbi:MAG: PEP-CTERM sorting domain-containing protein [Rheinheimera sp.]|nr:MAG: PEP-CTERM sorting domain-containing protein [Rheinheimera sp.]
MSKHMYKALLIVAGLAAGQASANLITNGSFEKNPTSAVVYNGNASNQPIGSFDDYGSLSNSAHRWAVASSLPGWDLFYGPGVEVQFNGVLGFNAQDGNRYVELDTHFAYNKPGNSNAGIYQKLTGMQIGATYELSFWYRSRTTKKDDNGLGVYWQPNAALLSQANTFTTVDYDPQEANNKAWTQYKVTLVASANEMFLGFGGFGDALYNANSATNGNGKGALLDNVSLNLVASPVSAPATLGLFGLAALGLMLRRRKA